MHAPASLPRLIAALLCSAAIGCSTSSGSGNCDGPECAPDAGTDASADDVADADSGVDTVDDAESDSGGQDVVADAAPDVADDAESDTDAREDAPTDASDAGSETGDADDVADAPEDVPPSDTSNPDVGDTPDEDADACGGTPVNACGGCTPLDRIPGSTCGACGDGEWVCETDEDMRCAGAVLTPQLWWIDIDRDGYGNPDDVPYEACYSPGLSWANNDDDCDDTDAGIYPGADEVCDGLDQDCDDAIDELPVPSACDDLCCDDALVCNDGTCVARCDEGVRCGAALDICCGPSEICYADACAEPSTGCTYTEECGVDEICEASLGVCIPRTAIPECEFVPPIGEFEPTIGCRWTNAGVAVNPTHNDVVATPIVINLTDDDESGAVDENDDPEIVFLTYDLGGGCCNVAATLRVVSGTCNGDGSMRTIASIDSPQLTNDSGIAAADLTGDGVAELIAISRVGGRPQGTVAFTRTAADASEWEVLWHNDTYPTWNVHTRGGAVISVANLDATGAPEVIVGNVALNGTNGALLWDGVVTSGGAGGVGNNAFLGPSSAVADVDLDGDMEVFAGSTLYDHEGAVLWNRVNATTDAGCDGALPCDGFTAIGNFDADDEAELVAVRVGEVFVWNHDGSELWHATIPDIDCAYNESGPPTIADFDGDGFPEIGTASADYYVVLDMNTCDHPDWAARGCSDRNILWKQQNNDCSSRATGSSVFDFEGDGRAEVVYADERNFRIMDGLTGAILYDDDTHRSHTRIEMPVIADVDNDGNAEIVIPENANSGGTNPGIEVWEDASDNWVRTRRVWNQHGYSVTHIREDGTVPTTPAINWLNPRLNTWRQNTQPAGLFDAPDLVIDDVRFVSNSCPPELFDVYVDVANRGALSVPAGSPIRIVLFADDGPAIELEERTPSRLFPGDEVTLHVRHVAEGTIGPPPYRVQAWADYGAAINECDESNNTGTSAEIDCYPYP